MFLHPSLGIVNYLLGLAGIAPVNWLGSTKVAFWTIIMVDIWHQVSFMIVLLLAGLSALPREPYEAARVDGANALQSFLHITLPLMRPVIVVTLLIRLIFAVKTYDLIYIMTRGGPGVSTDLVSYFIYRTAFVSLNIGEASAMSVDAAGHRPGAHGLSLPLHALAHLIGRSPSWRTSLSTRSTRSTPTACTAVRGVSLDIADGEFMILLGPSGCGKSTTLRMIAGLESVSRGDDLASAGGRVNDVDPARPQHRHRVPELRALSAHDGGAATWPSACKLARHRPATRSTRRIARHRRDAGHRRAARAASPRELSGGQRQRVALGRALVREPVAFLLDEPLSNLDAKLRASMRTELIKLHRQLGTTIVHVTHDQVEAMTMGERICIMKRRRSSSRSARRWRSIAIRSTPSSPAFSRARR